MAWAQLCDSFAASRKAPCGFSDLLSDSRVFSAQPASGTRGGYHAHVLETPLTIVSWNVNSLRARLPQVLRYLDERAPDVLCLQETKLDPDKVARAEFHERGYHVRAGGKGGYAGVATLSKQPIAEVVHGFADEPAHNNRRLLCQIAGHWVDNVYVPTRRAIGKAEFLEQLRQDYTQRFVAERDALVLCGDFNICFDARDLNSLRMISEPERFGERPEDLAFRRTLGFGLQDCLRKHEPEAKMFSWFPLTPWALRRNYGMRLDYIFATPLPYARCTGAGHDAEPRSWEQPSDHLPVVARFG
jgi:exodeoxyribonuclease III